MRFEDVWIAGTGGTVGDLVPVERAVEEGSYAAEVAESTGVVSVSQSAAAPPEMAVTAGRQAIKEAAECGVEIGQDTYYLHSHSHFQGLDMWPAACWIGRELIGTRLQSMPVAVGAASNGSLASLEIAANALAARPELPNALITIADRFAPPTDRWYLSPGMVFGDGGAAAVVSRGGGRLRLVSLVSETDTSLEGLSRGDQPFGTVPQIQPDMRKRTREFLAGGEVSLREVRARSAAGVRGVVTRALDEAGVAMSGIDWYAAPFVGRALYRDSFVRPLAEIPQNTLAGLGLTIGHLGPADQLYGLSYLLKEGLLQPGSRVLLLGTGMGFTFSAAVLAADGV
ncbi:ketoacyl-ACP synthase III family protein [Nonomuraea sp. K274]|uniref:asparaginase n=1 Tax=Nonomuraea cypriaca TaxID=1187855 RepID=A0A931AF29_9ACTN|nr:ketoacyl-ACP synthase III family protein [Nonomuraea cypriaca]MBF8191546.1 ketoacyl-ACP synthase III family protein [Nonomuraea cypriaca]